jgi:hypothetical protein
MPDILAQSPLTLVTNKAGSVAGTTTTLSITASPLQYAIANLFLNRATFTNLASPTVDFNSGLPFAPIQPNFGSVFVLMVDALGNLRVSQGQTTALDVTGAFQIQPDGPTIPDTAAVYAYLTVKVGSTGSAWTFGTSNMSGATGVTYTHRDVMGPLSRRLA